MTVHPDSELSPYADQGLGADLVPAVAAHLADCPRCARRVEELRAVRRLLAAAPAPRPARSLVPRLAPAPERPEGPERMAWLRPVRSLASIGAGAFLFLFVASAVLQSGGSLGGGTTAAERAAARGQLSAPAAAESARADGTTSTGASSASAPAASAAPQAVGLGSPAAEPRVAARRELGPPPWIFAVLAAISAAVALTVHRRLRRS